MFNDMSKRIIGEKKYEKYIKENILKRQHFQHKNGF